MALATAKRDIDTKNVAARPKDNQLGLIYEPQTLLEKL
jgi:hypothetical protein